MTDVNPYASPKSDTAAPRPPTAESALDGNARGVWQDIDVLVLRRDATLPDCCVMCACPADGHGITLTLRYAFPYQHPIIWWLAIILGPKAVVRIGFCEHHLQQRRTRMAISAILALLSVIVFVVSIEFSQNVVLPLGMMILCFASLFCLWSWNCPLKVDRIEGEYIWLKNVHPDYLRPLRWFPQYGEMMDLQ